jgi:hypothetical protein
MNFLQEAELAGFLGELPAFRERTWADGELAYVLSATDAKVTSGNQ